MKSKILALALAPALLVASGEASAADHTYVGAECVETNGGTSLQTFTNDHQASNMHATNVINVACPVVNPDPTAHGVCVDVQVWDVNDGASVSCRVTYRGATTVSQGAVGYSFGNVLASVGRSHIVVGASLPADAAYSISCSLPDTDPSASNIERYSVTDSDCLI